MQNVINQIIKLAFLIDLKSVYSGWAIFEGCLNDVQDVGPWSQKKGYELDWKSDYVSDHLDIYSLKDRKEKLSALMVCKESYESWYPPKCKREQDQYSN